ncbi:MAG: hypothetical protein R2879_21120 [Saprospiraceae bacterium]
MSRIYAIQEAEAEIMENNEKAGGEHKRGVPAFAATLANAFLI